MAQPQSPSIPIDGQNNDHQAQQLKSAWDVHICLPIAEATSQQYSQYTGHPATPMYASRPEWAGQHPQHQMPYGYPTTSRPSAPATVSPVQKPPNDDQLLSTFSYVPRDPSVQPHKRNRRRYEEIERIYKCGWNGCEKAYGTLNHLNAHVTMQSHGAKRKPEEFKEIRKERKAKKEGERRRAAKQNHVDGQMRQLVGVPGQAPGHSQLPPIGYQPAPSGDSSGLHYGTQISDSNDAYQHNDASSWSYPNLDSLVH